MKASPEYISAIAALTKIAEIKNLRSLEDYSYLINIPLIKEVNQEAINSIQVDIFTTKDSDNIRKYVNFLNEKVRYNLLPNNFEIGIEDELSLLSNAKNVSPNIIKEYTVEFYPDTNGDANSILQAAHLTKPNIISIARTAQYAQLLKVTDKTQDIYLLSAKTKVRSKECIVLIILIHQIIPMHNISFEKKLLITGVYFFNAENTRYSSPARLFLQMIEKFGRPITMGFKTQRFYYNGFAAGVNRKEFDKSFPRTLNMPSIQGGIRQTALGIEYYFFFIINADKLISDLKRLIFI